MFEPLSDEQRRAVMKSFKEDQAQGSTMPRLHASLLDFDPDTYKGITFPGVNDPKSHFPPNEFISFAYNATDAYAVALLATETFLVSGCTMTVSCKYKRGADDSLSLQLCSRTSKLVPELFGDRIAVFLTLLSAGLKVKEIQVNSMIFCSKVGAMATFRNPGWLIYGKSMLTALPEENWPVATRVFQVTDELRAKARHAGYLLAAPESDFNQAQ